MKIVINDKVKKDIFTALFQTLKSCTNIICVIFHDDYLYIQGMDKSHICLFNVKILKSWFNEYRIECFISLLKFNTTLDQLSLSSFGSTQV